MEQLERNKSILRKYIPEGSVDTIAQWIYQYNFKLKVKKSRASKIGDYMPPHSGKNHTITVNHDLNPYAFLVTLIHEVAHLVTWEKYKGRVSPHGTEWKSEYSRLLNQFLQEDKRQPEEETVFPKEISHALHRHILRPKAASCSDLNLSRVLKKFDTDSGSLLLERIAVGSVFRILHASRTSTETFIKGEKRRTRYHCIHSRTRRAYLIHALCKVELM
jgi:SprT protein